MNVMAPLKVEEARLHVEAIKKQKEISDIMDAPVQLQAKADLDLARNKGALQDVRDEASFLELQQSGALDDFRLSLNGPFKDFKKNRDAIKDDPVFWRNARVRAFVQAGETQVGTNEYTVGSGENMKRVRGAELFGRKDLADLDSHMTTPEEDQYMTALSGSKVQDMLMLHQLGGDTLENRKRMADRKAKNSSDLGKVFDLTEKKETLEEKLKEKRLGGPITKPRIEKLSLAGWENQFFTGERKTNLVDVFTVQEQRLNEAINDVLNGSQAYGDGTDAGLAELKRKKAFVGYLKRRAQMSDIRGFYAAVGGRLTAPGENAFWDTIQALSMDLKFAESPSMRRKVASDIGSLLASLSPSQEMDLMQQQRDRAALELQTIGTPGLPPEAGGYAPAGGGGLPSYTPEQAANLPVGTEFMGTDGKRYRR
jgi:hypothetical protein